MYFYVYIYVDIYMYVYIYMDIHTHVGLSAMLAVALQLTFPAKRAIGPRCTWKSTFTSQLNGARHP